MPAKLRSSGRRPLAYMTCNDGWTLYQNNSLGVRQAGTGAWRIAQFWQGKAQIYARSTECTFRGATYAIRWRDYAVTLESLKLALTAPSSDQASGACTSTPGP
eukprot:scaffold49312_cov17-Tisochrysis_lutea.AAC.1